MKEHELKISYVEKSHEELDSDELNLLKKATEAAQKAYAPYSHFRVGAAVLLENNEILNAGNQENAAYPSGLCAERVTMFYANAQFPNVPVKKIMIVVIDNNGNYLNRPTSPCGACRQALAETEARFEKNIKVVLVSEKYIYEFESIADLLPLTFSNKDLL